MECSGCRTPSMPAPIVTCPSFIPTHPTPEVAGTASSIHAFADPSSIHDYTYHDVTVIPNTKNAAMKSANQDYEGLDELDILVSNSLFGRSSSPHKALQTPHHVQMSHEKSQSRIKIPICDHTATSSDPGFDWSAFAGDRYGEHKTTLDKTESSASLSANIRSSALESIISTPVPRTSRIQDSGLPTRSGGIPNTKRALQPESISKHCNSSFSEDDLSALFANYDDYSFWDAELNVEAANLDDDLLTTNGSLKHFEEESLDVYRNTTFQDYSYGRYCEQPQQAGAPLAHSGSQHGCDHGPYGIGADGAVDQLPAISQMTFGSTATTNAVGAGITHHHPNLPELLTHFGCNEFAFSENNFEPACEGSLPLSNYVRLPQEDHVPSNNTTATHVEKELAAMKKAKMDFIIQCREKGMSYKAIKALGEFPEAESTLRGMVRNSTKDKAARPRKPVWTSRDVAILKETVSQFLSTALGYHALRSSGAALISTKAGERALHKVPWKQIAESMAHRGCHLYGNATVKKKYLEVMGYSLSRKAPKFG